MDSVEDLHPSGEGDAVPDEPLELSHEEQVAILHRAMAQLRTEGWKVYKSQPTPYEAALIRKSFATREFMAVWVEADGSVITRYAGKGGIQIVPFVFFPLN